MKLFVTFIWLFLFLTGCSSVKEHFPDKEKDYQFSSEIPPLDLPGDLKSDSVSQAEQVVVSTPADPNSVSTETVPVTTPDVAIGRAKEKGPANAAVEDTAQILTYTSGAIRVRVNAPIERGWSVVSRAISRQALEVQDRNRDKNYFAVMYDPNEKPVHDGSLLDEFLFLIGTKYTDEHEYRIHLVPNASVTEVMVTDTYDNPLSKGPGLALLHAIAEQINADRDD